MKKTLKHQTTNQEPRSTTKKYIERIIETEEAEKEIVEYMKRSCDEQDDNGERSHD